MPEHDTAYKLLFSQPRLVRDLFAEFVDPGITRELDFSTLRRVNSSYVSDDLREREDDLIWQIKTRKGRKSVYVYLLLEFQSTVDEWMPVRIMTYTGLLYQDLIRQKKVKRGQKLPVVFPLVLYNGDRAWKAARSLDELVQPMSGTLRKYRLPNEFTLIEERAVPKKALKPGENLVRLLFRLEQCTRIEEIQQTLESFWPYIDKKGLSEEQRAFSAWIHRVLRPGRARGQAAPKPPSLQEVKSMLAERARNWYDQAERRGLRRGRKAGLQEGRQEGLQEGHLEIVRRMARKGMREEAISDLTGISVAEVKKLLAQKKDA